MFDSFRGIKIYIYDADHPPPHFHAIYQDFEAVFSIETLDIRDGFMPPTQTKQIKKWGKINQEFLRKDFNLKNPPPHQKT